MSKNNGSNNNSTASSNTKLHDKVGTIEFALKYPFSNTQSKWNPVLFGVVMNLLSFLIVPVFTQIGYVFRIREAAANGDAEAPLYEDFAELTKEGFLVFLLLFGFLAVFFILAVAFQAVLGDAAVIPNLLLYIVLLYAVPAASILYSVHRSYGETLNRLPEVLKSGWYLKATLLYLAFSIGLVLGLAILSAITLGIGALVLVPVLLYVRPCYWGHFYYKNKSKLKNP